MKALHCAKCDTIIMYYTGEGAPQTGAVMKSEDWRLLDGTPPSVGDRMPRCSGCRTRPVLRNEFLREVAIADGVSPKSNNLPNPK